jgi:hypothetical protein
MRAYFDNLRLACIYSMLGLAKIYWDKNGNLLPSSSNATLTIDYGLPANNANQLNGLLTVGWENASADIPGDCRKIKDQSLRDTGYPLKYAFYGKNVPSYLAQNTEVQAYLSRNPATHQKFLDTGELPDLFGYQWWPVHQGSFYEDNSGVIQELFGADQVTFTPDITAETYELMEGTYMVPTTFNAFDSLTGALASMTQVRGMFSYAVPVHNPVTVELFYGDVFLPIWKVTNNWYQATVNF